MPNPFIVSRHACERILDMAISPDEVRAAFERPLAAIQSGKSNAWYLTRGRITLVLSDDETPTLMTVIWARASDLAADQQLPALPGRESTKPHQTREVQRLRKRNR